MTTEFAIALLAFATALVLAFFGRRRMNGRGNDGSLTASLRDDIAALKDEVAALKLKLATEIARLGNTIDFLLAQNQAQAATITRLSGENLVLGRDNAQLQRDLSEANAALHRQNRTQ